MLSAFAGLLAENPTSGYGWRFLGIGRRLEVVHFDQAFATVEKRSWLSRIVNVVTGSRSSVRSETSHAGGGHQVVEVTVRVEPVSQPEL